MENNYKEQSDYAEMDLLRFTTAGSVDDGKSTLIGRLLYDSKNILKIKFKLLRSLQRKEEMIILILLF